MIRKKQTKGTRFVAFLVAAAILVGMGTAFAAEDDEASLKDICRRALDRCVLDAIKSGGLGNLINLVALTASCLAGYDFCLKYVRILSEEIAR